MHTEERTRVYTERQGFMQSQKRHHQGRSSGHTAQAPGWSKCALSPSKLGSVPRTSQILALFILTNTWVWVLYFSWMRTLVLREAGITVSMRQSQDVNLGPSECEGCILPFPSTSSSPGSEHWRNPFLSDQLTLKDLPRDCCIDQMPIYYPIRGVRLSSNGIIQGARYQILGHTRTELVIRKVADGPEVRMRDIVSLWRTKENWRDLCICCSFSSPRYPWNALSHLLCAGLPSQEDLPRLPNLIQQPFSPAVPSTTLLYHAVSPSDRLHILFVCLCPLTRI